MYFLSVQLKRMVRHVTKDFCHVNDYSVYVTHLPPSADARSLRSFFDQRYQLCEPDWREKATSRDYVCGCCGKHAPRILRRVMGIPLTAQSFHDSHDDTYAPSGRHLVGRRIQISVSAQGDDDERGERGSHMCEGVVRDFLPDPVAAAGEGETKGEAVSSPEAKYASRYGTSGQPLGVHNVGGGGASRDMYLVHFEGPDAATIGAGALGGIGGEGAGGGPGDGGSALWLDLTSLQWKVLHGPAPGEDGKRKPDHHRFTFKAAANFMEQMAIKDEMQREILNELQGPGGLDHENDHFSSVVNHVVDVRKEALDELLDEWNDDLDDALKEASVALGGGGGSGGGGGVSLHGDEMRTMSAADLRAAADQKLEDEEKDYADDEARLLRRKSDVDTLKVVQQHKAMFAKLRARREKRAGGTLSDDALAKLREEEEANFLRVVNDIARIHEQEAVAKFVSKHELDMANAVQRSGAQGGGDDGATPEETARALREMQQQHSEELEQFRVDEAETRLKRRANLQQRLVQRQQRVEAGGEGQTEARSGANHEAEMDLLTALHIYRKVNLLAKRSRQRRQGQDPDTAAGTAAGTAGDGAIVPRRRSIIAKSHQNDVARPCRSSAHNGDEAAVGSWVAAVKVVTEEVTRDCDLPPHMIRSYLAHNTLQRKLEHAQHAVLRYAPGTPHKHGPDAHKEELARHRAQKLSKKLQNIQRHIKKQHHLGSEKKVGAGAGGGKSGGNSVHESGAVPVLGAYITFENFESRRRCLEDYRSSGNWWGRMLQPYLLRFDKNLRPRTAKNPNDNNASQAGGANEPPRRLASLHVRPAPDPSDVLWENLDASWCSRMCRRSMSTCATVLLLLLSFAIIWQGNYLQRQFQEQSPDLTLCGAIAEQYGNEGAARSVNSSAFLSEANRTDGYYGIVHSAALDATCATAIPVAATAEAAAKRVWLSFGNVSANETYLAAFRGVGAAAAAGGTAANTTDCRSPCVDLDDKTLKCPVEVTSALTGKTTTQYFLRADVVAGCFCKQELASRVAAHGLLGAALNLGETEGTVCGDFAGSFAATNSILLAVSLVVAFVNTALKGVLKTLARFEHHHSVSALSASIVLKVFLAQFLNTALIIVVVNAKLVALTIDIGIGKIFDGEFDEFDMRWYAVVGASVSLTMVLNIVIPHLGPVIQWLVVSPLKRKCTTVYSQQAMDKLYARPEFSLTTRFSMVMNTTFVTLLFCSGLPILVPIAGATFALTYFIDKALILKFYRRPPRYDESLVRTFIASLPWALAFHLIFAMVAYSASEVFASDTLGVAELEGYLSQVQAKLGEGVRFTCYSFTHRPPPPSPPACMCGGAEGL